MKPNGDVLRKGACALVLVAPVAAACPPSSAARPAVRTTAAGAMVMLAGCVVDAGYLPRSTAVHALTATGRLVGTAHADERGLFRLQVPSQTTLRLILGSASAQARGVMDLRTTSADMHLDACVVDLSPMH